VADFLTTTNITARLEDIIREAKAGEKLVLVSPFVQISPRLIDNLKAADKRRVKIILIYGKKQELGPDEMDKLNDLQNLSLYYHPNLHAKCYYNEKQLIITSMNLYDFSQTTNHEMGVLVQKQKEEDKAIYDQAVKEVDFIQEGSTPMKKSSGLAAAGKAVVGLARALADGLTDTLNNGHCIRCGQVIPFDPKRPYCGECYGEWARHKNKTHIEEFCHGCGGRNNSSMRRPLCLACWEEDND
jgi:HKD family nuclease